MADNSEDILTNSENPQSASSPAGSVTRYSIADQIAADKYRTQKKITNPFRCLTLARGKFAEVDGE
jgi:hypothetical protein